MWDDCSCPPKFSDEVFYLPEETTLYVPRCRANQYYGGRIKHICLGLEMVTGKRILNFNDADRFFIDRFKRQPNSLAEKNEEKWHLGFMRRKIEYAIYHSYHAGYIFKRDVARIIREIEMPRSVPRCMQCNRCWPRYYNRYEREQLRYTMFCSERCDQTWLREQRRQEEDRICLREGRERLREIRRWLRNRSDRSPRTSDRHGVS